jgi:hypothetical protein
MAEVTYFVELSFVATDDGSRRVSPMNASILLRS